MKILAINASYRGDKGHTRFLIDKLFAGATAAGAECQVVTLTRLKINRCLACGQCQTAEHHLECVYDGKDDTQMVFRQMVEVDIVVYATPVYVFGLSGLLKTFLERFYSRGNSGDLRVSKSGLMFHHVDHSICSKPFVTLVCCDNLEDETPRNVLAYFRTLSRFLDAPQVGGLVRNGGRLSGHGHDPERENQVPKILDVYVAYKQAGRELATEGRIRRFTERRANQEIVPVPLFSILKHLKRFKRIMVERAREMI
ncbi:MAG: flavodoxin family protein [Chloroflexota bacterium]|nr:flavodoxin family protein [Chloroflexota bacterium]